MVLQIERKLPKFNFLGIFNYKTLEKIEDKLATKVLNFAPIFHHFLQKTLFNCQKRRSDLF